VEKMKDFLLGENDLYFLEVPKSCPLVLLIA